MVKTGTDCQLMHAVIGGLKAFCSFRYRWLYGGRYCFLEARPKVQGAPKLKLILAYVNMRSKLRPYQFERKLRVCLRESFNPKEGCIIFLALQKPTSGTVMRLKQLKGVFYFYGPLREKKAFQLLYNWITERIRKLKQYFDELQIDLRSCNLDAATTYHALLSLAKRLAELGGLTPPT